MRHPHPKIATEPHRGQAVTEAPTSGCDEYGSQHRTKGRSVGIAPSLWAVQEAVEDHGSRNSPSRSTASMKVAHSDRVKRTEPELGLLELRTSTTSSTRRTSTHCPFVPL